MGRTTCQARKSRRSTGERLAAPTGAFGGLGRPRVTRLTQRRPLRKAQKRKSTDSQNPEPSIKIQKTIRSSLSCAWALFL